MAAAPDYYALLAGRLIVGLSVGGASHTVPLYLAETAPVDERGKLVGFNNVFIVLGQVLASLVDCGFGLKCVPEGWRWMLGLHPPNRPKHSDHQPALAPDPVGCWRWQGLGQSLRLPCS